MTVANDGLDWWGEYGCGCVSEYVDVDARKDLVGYDRSSRDPMNNYSIVIPSRNIDNLIACVQQIRTMEETARIIVIDDGLDWWGPEMEMARRDGARGEVYCTGPLLFLEDDCLPKKPFVFARAINQGILEAGRDDVVLLNDDCLLKTPLGFRILRHQIYENPKFGAICPGFNVGGCRHMNLVNQRRPHLAVEPIMLIFACCYIPRSTINLVGLLDERFGVNAGGTGPRGYGLEDDDYSLRIRKHGLQLGVYDGVYADHTSLKSTFRSDPEHKADVRIHEELFRTIHGHWPEGHGLPPR